MTTGERVYLFVQGFAVGSGMVITAVTIALRKQRGAKYAPLFAIHVVLGVSAGMAIMGWW